MLPTGLDLGLLAGLGQDLGESQAGIAGEQVGVLIDGGDLGDGRSQPLDRAHRRSIFRRLGRMSRSAEQLSEAPPAGLLAQVVLDPVGVGPVLRAGEADVADDEACTVVTSRVPGTAPGRSTTKPR